MAKRSSSNRWKQRQATDPYVQRAKAEGWRSRAAFKLLELQAKDKLLRVGDTAVDLGAAPGGWSQVAASIVKDAGRVVAVDLLDMDPLPGVDFIQGDFTTDDVLQKILDLLPDRGTNLVMSDMAPNISGNRAVDQPRSMYLAELTLDLAEQVLRKDGHLVAKVFQGEGFEPFLKHVRTKFKSVKMRKPDSSRPSSREMYLVARNYRI